MNKPLIYVWDLETGFNKAAVFGIGKRWVPHTAILQERYIICGTLKEVGVDSTITASITDDWMRFLADPTDDYFVVKSLHHVLSQADVLIAHYGDAFDMKFFNTRAIYHGLDPLPNIVQIDTYKMAKQKFLFNSNKLDYIAQYLGVGEKISTTEGLWHGCMNGDTEAVKEMVKYNIHDVLILEKVYEKLRSYTSTKINFNIFDRECCPKCSSNRIHKRGFQYTLVNKYQRYKCIDCGGWFRSGTAEKEHKTGALR